MFKFGDINIDDTIVLRVDSPTTLQELTSDLEDFKILGYWSVFAGYTIIFKSNYLDEDAQSLIKTTLSKSNILNVQFIKDSN
jgi:hypothetical protein